MGEARKGLHGRAEDSRKGVALPFLTPDPIFDFLCGARKFRCGDKEI